MNPTNQGKTVLEDFRAFLSFLQSLWGILTSISVLFPLSNAFTEVIPLGKYGEDGGLVYFSPHLVTAVATLTALFTILWTFGQRYKIRAHRESRLITRKAWFSFAIGLLALVIYLVVNLLAEGAIWYVLFEWTQGELRRTICELVADIALLLSYSAFFALMTRAFMLLGMIEFFARENKPTHTIATPNDS